MERPRPPFQLLLGNGQREVGQGVEDLLDRGDGDDLRRVLGRAGVRTGSPGQVGSLAVLPAGLGQRGIAVGRGEADDDRCVGLGHHSPEVHVLHRVVGGVVGDGRLVPQHVVDRLPDQQPGVAPAGVGRQQQEQGVADEVALGFHAGAHQHDELVLEFLVGEPGGVLDQPGGDVVAGPAALEGDQLHQAGGEFLVGAQGVLAVEDRRHGAGEGVADVRRAAEELVEQQQRQQLGVVVEEVGPASLAELVDEVVGDGLDVTADAGDVEPGQAVRDGLAQPQVHGAVGEQAVGPVRHHRQHRAVQPDAPFVECLPAAGVPGEERGVLQHAQRHLVADDQGGVDAGGEFDRSGRSVGAQPVVDLVRVGGERRVVHGASGAGGGGG